MIIYKITNNVNQKIYIGQTINSLNRRKIKHKHTSTFADYPISRAIRKYSIENFSWDILCECTSKTELNAMECHYILQYRSNIPKFGYNLTLGGEGCVGYKHTEESLEKMRNIKTSKETRQKMSLAAKGRSVSKEACEKLRQRMLGSNNHNYNKFGEDNSNSKIYIVTDPTGVSQTITGLNHFCSNNNLNSCAMNNVAQGRKDHHKGWKCVHKDKNLQNEANIKRDNRKILAKFNLNGINKYELISPENQIIIVGDTRVNTLNNFCKDNNLQASHMAAIARGERKHHKGWKCKKLS